MPAPGDQADSAQGAPPPPPAAADGFGGGGGGGGGGGARAAAGRGPTCFACGAAGHVSRDCPAGRSAGGAGGGGGGRWAEAEEELVDAGWEKEVWQ